MVNPSREDHAVQVRNFARDSVMFCHWVPGPGNPVVADIKIDLTLLANRKRRVARPKADHGLFVPHKR